MTYQRIMADILLFIAILFLPWWIYIPILIALTVVMPIFWEGILLGFLIDTLYGTGLFDSFWLEFPTALSIAILLIVAEPLRVRLRFHV